MPVASALFATDGIPPDSHMLPPAGFFVFACQSSATRVVASDNQAREPEHAL